jgi:hypothetical protein
MPKLFRKIRQKFLYNRRFNNYILYALGEILLVVVGILIALAINNQHEHRTIRLKEQTYLTGLHKEFQINKLKLEELIRVNKRSYERAMEILTYMHVGENKPDEEAFAKLLYQTFAFDITFNPNNSLLFEMINSGSLKDLSNGKMGLMLTTWIATLEDIKNQESELKVQREKVMDLFRSEKYSIRTVISMARDSATSFQLPASEKPISNLSLLESTEFENNVILYMTTCYATDVNHYVPLLEHIGHILALLESETGLQPKG